MQATGVGGISQIDRMKFQKGLLNDIAPKAAEVEKDERPVAGELPHSEPAVPVVEKDRLFETVKEEIGSERRYLKVLGIVVAVVMVIGFAIFYLSAPGVGDRVRAPGGLEDAVRDHFLTKEKRTATDMTFYQCGDYYWTRVGVETRPDIANPIYKIATYTARAASNGGQWSITATPIDSPEMDVPCK